MAGTLVNVSVGDYRLVEFLGAGGMGEVYRAVHAKIGRVAAIKVLNERAGGSTFAERFVNEARIHSSLHHPHIAELYDYVEIGGRACIFMEYVDGVTLHDRIRAAGRLPAAEALKVLRDVASALAYVHGLGVVHRDVKSINIKISSRGQVKLLDFGIAKDSASRKLTMVGGCIGTMDYLAPEQIQGKPSDQRADIWALGVLLYEMVTGVLPFAGDSLGSLCERITKARYVPARDLAPLLPPGIDGMIARCLQPSPGARYQSAAEVGADIASLELAPGAAESTAQKGPSLRALARDYWMVPAAAVVLAVAAGLILISGNRMPESDKVSVPLQTAQPPADPQPSPGSEKSARIRIETLDLPAEVYDKDGVTHLGSTQGGFERSFSTGTRVDLILRRTGCQDAQVQLEVGETDRQYQGWLCESASGN